MNTILNISAAIISPAIVISAMAYMINSVNKRIDDTNKRIDDLRSQMKSDNEKLVSTIREIIVVAQGIDNRLENLNQTMTRHLEFHASDKS